MYKRWELATRDEVKDVAANLRKEDFQEGLALRGIDIRPWMVENYNPGCTYVMKNSAGDNVGLCGVDDVGNLEGLIWMVATPKLLDHQIEFLRHGRLWIEEATRPYKVVGNIVHAKNEVHLKWLKWCGFTFLRKIQAGPFKEDFYEFLKVI